MYEEAATHFVYASRLLGRPLPRRRSIPRTPAKQEPPPPQKPRLNGLAHLSLVHCVADGRKKHKKLSGPVSNSIEEMRPSYPPLTEVAKKWLIGSSRSSWFSQSLPSSHRCSPCTSGSPIPNSSECGGRRCGQSANVVTRSHRNPPAQGNRERGVSVACGA